MSIQVLFVCLGNICRSPTAHGLFQYKVEQAGLNEMIYVDSAGTGAWHSGSAPDQRAQDTALKRGYNISHLRARQVTEADFNRFDYILAMDEDNLHHLEAIKPDSFSGTLGLFLDVALEKIKAVPDPYYGDAAHFQEAIDLIEQGAEGLLKRIRQEHDC